VPRDRLSDLRVAREFADRLRQVVGEFYLGELQRRLWTDPPRGGFVIQCAAPVAVAAALS
jgi:hypothetical protein